MKNRIDYFDIAKGIGILCIIAGHMGVDGVNRIVFTFHVPIFFLISGYFISQKGSFIDYARKRFKTLLYPYAFTSVCLILIKIPVNIISGTPELISSEMKTVFIQALYGSGGNENLTPFNIGQIGAIWFLWALFWAILATRFAISKSWGGYFILIVALLSYFSTKYFWLPFDIQAGGTASVFVYVGAIIRKYKSDMFEHTDEALFLSGLLALIMSANLGFQLYINANYFSHGVVSIICAILISCFVIYLSKYISLTKMPKKVLLFYGNNSIIILCFHLIEQNNFPYYTVLEFLDKLSVPYNYQMLFVFFIKVALSTMCTLIVLKFRLLRKIFSK